jgi:diguanylate cyclase (GGDEF)-like protein/PAS domain S-box-containing protein
VKLPLSTRAIIFGSIVGGGLTLFWAARSPSASGQLSSGQWITAVAIGALIAGNWLWPVVIYIGDRIDTFHMDEGSFVILALVVPPIVTLATLAAASIVGQVIRRRQFVKSTFNVGQVLIAAGLGLAVSRSIAPLSGSLTVARASAVLLAAVIYFIVNKALVGGLMVSLGAAWSAGVSVEVPLAIAGVVLGVVVAVAVEAHPLAVVAAVPALVIELRLVTGRFTAQHDRTRMKGLFDVTLEANRRLRPDAVLDTVVASARHLLRCETAKVTAVPPDPSEMATALEVDGRRQWLVVSGRRREEPFDQADRILLDALAAIGRSALANAELYRQVRLERERLASISLSIGDGVCAVDNEGRLTFVNPAAAEMIHLPSLSVPVADGDVDDALRAPDFLADVAAAVMTSGLEISEDDVHFPARTGGTVPVSYNASPVVDGGVAVGAVITFRDITERKAHADQMAHHAYHDSLTGLGNRRLLVEQLGRALEESAVDGKTHALIFVDVDRFKSINDSLGHLTGDDLLAAIAARMKATIRPGDLLARFGGDEFTVLLEDIGGIDDAIGAAQRICEAVEEPLILADGYEIVASLSVGITLTEPGKGVDDILRDADVAMYEAKVKGGGGAYKVFDMKAMGARSPERVSLEADLRRSLERDELEVYYQPFYSVPDQEIVGCEALVRWRHPTQGLLEPGRFIGLAEETGLILPIGQFVLDQACQQARAIRDRLGVALPISVNLSARQFRQNTIVNEVAAALDRASLDPSALTLEITETMVMDDLSSAREIMKRLNRLGVRLAIDDFGTGHSSLSYLKQFPVHEVKVDRVFVQGMSDHPVDAAIVRAVVELASAMGMLAVAEGVETVDQLSRLRTLCCPVAQGYYFSRPLPIADYDRLLERQFGPPSSQIIQLRPRRRVS